MQPMNYTIQTPNPGEAFQQGMQQTAGMMTTVADYQKAQAMATAAQQKAEHDAYKRQRFMQAAKNPTSKEVQGLLLEFPELHEGISKSLEFMSADEKKNTQQMAFSVLSALEKGKGESAVTVIDQQLEAAKRSNNQEQVQRLGMLRDGVIGNPDAARFGLKGMLFASMGGKDYGDLMKNIEAAETESQTRESTVAKGKADASEAQSKATIAAAKAKFAESDAAMDLQKKGWDITKIQEDIKIAKMNSQIAAMNAQTSRMNAGTAAEEKNIKLLELKEKRDEAVRGKVAEVEAARFNIDNMLNTADRVLKTPKGVISSAAGPISSRIPTMSSDTADFEALVESLGSQAFLSQLPNIKGMGQLSNAEGDKLQASLQNMSLKQSPERLVENVKEAQRLLLKVRKNVATRYGVPESVPDTPAAAPSGANIDALLKKYGQ